MVKTVSIIGSTGSIGTQTLEVIRELNEKGADIRVIALSAGNNVGLLLEQAREFNVKYLSIVREKDAETLRENLRDINPEVYSGDEGLNRIAEIKTDLLFTAIVGMRGLLPTITAINAGNNIALANKETLVSAGSIVMNLAKEKGVIIFPVDSEHNAILQCLDAGQKKDVKKLIITASGGPFRAFTKEDMYKVSVEDALNHPTWNMGGKITIDSATLMNKGLEVIEAMHLFDMDAEDIEVVVHPQSIIHSMVCYKDNSVIAQLSMPSMKLPIQYALTYPDRMESRIPQVSFAEIGTLTFEEPDLDRFPCLKYAYEAARTGGTMPCVMNAANEVCAESFLRGEIPFMTISEIVKKVMEGHKSLPSPDLEDILMCDLEARRTAGGIIDGYVR